MMFIKKISKEEVNELPLVKYEGKVEVVNTLDHLEHILKVIHTFDVVGFDTESKPTFRRGDYNHVSLVQIAIPEKVFLVRIHLTGFTEELRQLFQERSIKKVGISIKDDIKDLQKLSYFNHNSVIDLNNIAWEMGVKHAGVRNLSAIFLQSRISKSQQTSNWEKEKLTEKQIRYAATDAWVCLEIYDKLKYWGYV